VHLIDEENTRDKLSNALVDVSIDYFVDLTSKFLGNFCLLRLHDLSHQTHEIVTPLRTSIGHIKIVKGDILNNFFLFVDISFGKRYILLSLKIKLAGV